MISELMMDLHDMSVSGEKAKESVGRLMKETAEATFGWMDDEIQRGTNPYDIMQALIRSHVGITSIVAARGFEVDARFVEAIGSAYKVGCDSFAKHIARAEQNE